MDRLAKVFRRLNAYVVALQEVENRGYLQRFVDVCLEGLGYEHVVHFEGNDMRGIDVCLISKLPVGTVRSHRHLSFAGPDGEQRRFQRDVLAVTVEPPGGTPLEVWVVHLKSNTDGREFAEPVRLAEAMELRRLLDQALRKDAGARILVMGDFNDTWDSQTIKTIVGTEPMAMWSPTVELSGDLPDTYNTGRYQSMIDFILCSPAMAKTYVSDSWKTDPGSPETSGSDHNPVTAQFRVNGP
jgi:endonuclease/exonuclease/phosphatase family metal-dependent hydrolase